MTKRLRKVEALLASLTAAQLTSLAEFEKTDIAKAQKALHGIRRPGRGRPQTVLGEAHRAIRYARKQLGKPYEWGAEGPKSYDCSGLTSEAWAHAGTPIPRTSQEQWAQLDRVPLTELRPGDLVIYFPDATHVAIYVGDGKVVQAPRPGAKIRISPIASNPVLGAVRPEAGRGRRSRPVPETSARYAAVFSGS